MTTRTVPPDTYAFSDSVSPSPWWIRVPVLLLLGIIALMMVLGALLMGFQMAYRTLIVPNVWIMGTAVGGLSVEAAAARVADSFQLGQTAVFTFRDGDNFWQVSAADLGVRFDAEASVAQAFAVGHSGSPLTDVVTSIQTLTSAINIAPIIVYDQQQTMTRLATIAAEIRRDPVNASLTLNGTLLETSEGANGRMLDITTTLNRLETQLLLLRGGGEIELAIHETPPLVYSVADVSQQIQTALSQPVQLIAADDNRTALGPWTATTDQIAQLLRLDAVQNSDGTQSYAAHIDGAAFEAYLQALAPGLITPTQNARFHFNEASGALEVIQPAMSGRTLNVAETVRRLEDAVFSLDNRVVPMAFDYTLPRYHNQITAAELGIQQVVAEATTTFTGSPQNRRTNIALAASRFDGLVIAPGEEFSFNYYLGDISEEGGFVEGKVIVGDRTVIGIGGGTCQVSTTLFRAAFYGGFAITERNSHGYRVGYYEQGSMPPGLDAAIWQPERDFRFQNNTPHHLLIQTSVYPTSDALQFRFYSTAYFRTEVDPAIVKNITAANPTRFEASTEVPVGQSIQVDYSAEGADVTVYRRIYDLAGTLLTEDSVYTHYLPWGAIYQVAPGDSRLANS